MARRFSTYYELSLLVGDPVDQHYPISASSEGLPRRREANLPRTEVLEKLSPMAEQLRQRPLPPGELKQFGSRLFEALIRGQVREMYRFLEGSYGERLSFRLVLNLRPAELQRLPWECMYDPYRQEYLSLQDKNHIIRQVDRTPEGGVSQGDSGYGSVVIAIANARGQPPIDRQREQELIDAALGDLHRAGKLNRNFIRGSQDEIQNALAGVPDVFHFVGHGGFDRNDLPGLYLEDSYGDAIFETGSGLEYDYFKPPPGSRRRVRLLVLSACQTSETPKTEGHNSLAHQLVSQVEAVLAMQYPVLVDNLTDFNAAFYQALASGSSLETAVNAARREVFSDKPRGARDWIAPVLVTHRLTPSRLLQLVSQNPFKGPIYYDVSDRKRFYGREREIEDLMGLFLNHSTVVVRGWTGSGKTSLLRAGLMASVGSDYRIIYLSLNENLSAQLRMEVNKILVQDERAPLSGDELEKLTGLFPNNLAILIDRVEQVEHLSEEIARLVTALVGWANDPAQTQRRTRLVLATRLNEQDEEPALVQRIAPAPANPRLDIDMLDYNQAEQWIGAATRESPVVFLPETIRSILLGLRYDHPEDRNMMALQVVCSAVYRRARQSNRQEAGPELLAELDGVEGILERDFTIASRLNQAVYAGGDEAKKVLAQFVSSDRASMRPRSWHELQLRCGLEPQELDRVLDLLLEDGLLHLEFQPGEEKYELVHEALINQVDWLTEADIQLRKLEEVIESAGPIIPWRSEFGGLEDLDARRDDLALSAEHQKLLLRSALEADHQTAYWFERVEDPEEALSVLTSPYLSAPARKRACRFLNVLGAREESYADRVKQALWTFASESESPQVRQAASLAFAPIIDETFVEGKFGVRREALETDEIEALARIFDSRWLPLKNLPGNSLTRIRRTLLRLNGPEIFSAAIRAGGVGAVGFGLAGVWNYAQAYRSPAVTNLPPLTLLLLELSLIGLITLILALPGAMLAPLGRDLVSILSGGRRDIPGAIGAILGSALGVGLTVALLAALAEYRDPSLFRLVGYFFSGALIGTAVALPWLLGNFTTRKPEVIIPLATVLGGLAFLVISRWSGWWPSSSFVLTLDARYGWEIRLVAGMLIGLGSATGLTWGKLRKKM